MSAIVGFLIAFLPGTPLAAFLLGRANSPSKLFRLSLVITLVLASLIGWAPLGEKVPLATWLVLLGLLASWGGWAFVSLLKKRESQRQFIRPVSLFRALSFAALAVSALILLVRPNIDWDAIDYYLLSAIDAVINGHYTIFFSHYVELSSHAPNTVLPAIPTLYALAIQVAQYAHESADVAIRLIAFAFILGIWLTTRDIACYYLDASWSEFAGLLSIVIPGVLFAIVSVPLLLDLSFTFLTLELIALLHGPGLESRTKLLALGLTASALTIDKIDGLPTFVLITAAFLLQALRRRFALCAVIIVESLMLLAAVHVHLLDLSTPPLIYVAILAVSALLAIAVTLRTPRVTFPWSRTYWVVLGFIPGLFEIAKLIALTGSPAGYYLPSLARNQSASWLAAVEMITRAHVYAPSTQPGIPENLGIGLLLWYGFGPPFMIALLLAVFTSVKKRQAILSLLAAVTIFELAFLTIFGLQDLRHILPVLPISAIMISFGFANWPGDLRTKRIAMLVAAVFSLPFAWDAQQRFFGPPFALIVKLKLDQWQQLSNEGQFYTLLIVIVTFAVLISVTIWLRREHAKEPGFERILAVGAGIIFVVWYTPLLMTMLNPGFTQQRRIVEYNQDNGYVPALLSVLSANPGETVLTFENFGVTWYSRGSQRRAELTDATDLELLLPSLQERGLGALSKLGIRVAILPAPSTAAYQAFIRLTTSIGQPELADLYSRDVSKVLQYGGWYVLRPKNGTSWSD